MKSQYFLKRIKFHTLMRLSGPLLLAAVLSCSSTGETVKATSDSSAAGSALDELLTDYANGISLKYDNPAEAALKIKCPVAVLCDEKYYRAFTLVHEGDDFSLFFYISFDGKLIGNLNDASVKKNFSYMYYILQPAGLKKQGWDIRIGSEQPFRRGNPAIKELSYKNGRLKVELIHEGQLSTRGVKEMCAPADGKVPPECQVTTDKTVSSLSIEIDLPLPDGVFDCTKKENYPNCG